VSRIAEHDFSNLEKYLAEYRVAPSLGANNRSVLFKRAHRQVLAALQIWSHLESLIASEEAAVAGIKIAAGSESQSLVCEYFSDLTGALACVCHGLYKPANILLRSGIENLVRGLASLSSLEARETTSVFRLFEIASSTTPFIGLCAPFFQTLQQVYGDLCSFVHSATPSHRSSVNNISSLSRHDTGKLKEFVNYLERINKSAVSILALTERRVYLDALPRVRDLLDDVLPTAVRLEVLGANG
jgi:hypothetical protein